MKLTGSRAIAAPVDVVWTALNDPAVIQACVPGCESIERTGDDAYRMVVAQQIGPVSARFSGTMRILDPQPPSSYTLRFEGSGAAGFAKGEARVALATDGAGGTTLSYEADAQIGGKLAQIGSRLVDAVAARQADDFFSRFTALMAERTPPAQPEPAMIPSSEPPKPAQRSARVTATLIVVGAIGLLAWAFMR